MDDLIKRYSQLLGQGLNGLGRNVSDAVQGFSHPAQGTGYNQILNKAANIQHFIQSPAPVQLPPVPQMVAKAPVIGGVAQAGRFIANPFISGVGNFTSDLGDITGRALSGQAAPQYNQVKSPVSRLMMQAAAEQARLHGNPLANVPLTPQAEIGNAAGSALIPLTYFGGFNAAQGGAAGLAGKIPLAQLAKQGAINGALTGGAYGTLSGLSTGWNAPNLKSPLMEGAKQGAVGAAVGGAVGAAVPVIGRGIQNLLEGINDPATQAVATGQRGGAKIPAKYRNMTLAEIQNQGGRAQSQTALEKALNAKDYAKAQDIIDSLDDNDPYKLAMQHVLDAAHKQQTPLGKLSPEVQGLLDKIHVGLETKDVEKLPSKQDYAAQIMDAVKAGDISPAEARMYAQDAGVKLPKLVTTLSQADQLREMIAKSDRKLVEIPPDQPKYSDEQFMKELEASLKQVGNKKAGVPTKTSDFIQSLDDAAANDAPTPSTDFVKSVSNAEHAGQISPDEASLLLGNQGSKLSKVTEVAGMSRELMATGDLSAPLRQGAFLAPSKPKEFGSAMKAMFKSLTSEDGYQAVNDEIASRPSYDLMRSSGLALTNVDDPMLSGREEQFASTLAEKIPGFGKIARGSNRAYTGFLNKYRADVFDSLLNSAAEQGQNVEQNPRFLADAAKFVNSATGRGVLPGHLEESVPALSQVLFSPRLMASRLNLLSPRYYMTLEPAVRQQALTSLVKFGATALTILGAAKLAGAAVTADPRSTDFGKIKIGNTRYDILAGFGQYIRVGAQLASGQTVSSTNGKVANLGQGYNSRTRLDVLSDFIQNKEAPIPSLITTLLKGKDGAGQPLKIGPEIASRFIPLLYQDIYDLSKEWGAARGAVMAVPAAFGVGVQTYGSTPPTKYTTSSDAPQNILDKAMLYGKSAFVDPGNTFTSLSTGQPLRKLTGDTATFERQQGLSSLDNGDPSTQVDHTIALALGGSNSPDNLEVLSTADNLAKGVVETHLFRLLQSGQITKEQAQQRDQNWRAEVSKLPATDKTQLKAISPAYQAKLSGEPVLDKLELSKQSSSITAKINAIRDQYEAGAIAPSDASKQIADLQAQQKTLKAKTSTSTTKAKKPKKIVVSKFKLPKIPKPKKVKKLKLSSVKIKVPTIKVKRLTSR